MKDVHSDWLHANEVGEFVSRDARNRVVWVRHPLIFEQPKASLYATLLEPLNFL